MGSVNIYAREDSDTKKRNAVMRERREQRTQQQEKDEEDVETSKEKVDTRLASCLCFRPEAQTFQVKLSVIERHLLGKS